MAFLLCAEFPCDNPALFEDEAIVLPDIEEVVEAIVAPRESGIIAIVREEIPSLFEIEDEEPFVVEEIEIPSVVSLEGEIEREHEQEHEQSVETVQTILPPAPDDPFLVLVSALADVAVGLGSPAVAAMMPAVLLETSLPAVEPEILAHLVDGGMAGVDGTLTPKFIGTMRAWHAILSGTSNDFDACGGAMLDEWCAGLLARLLGTPARTDALRKELRSRGVAAFGLAA